jgi:1-deoxy-D-xylulose-5-phosphate synthase
MAEQLIAAAEEVLSRVDTPEALRALDKSDLKGVAQAVRDYLVGSVSQTGGHLAAGLGVVELNVALNYVFNTP